MSPTLPRLAILALLVNASCQRPAERERADEPSFATVPLRVNDPAGIHNLFEVVPGVWSGSIPEGDAGFDSLAEMGIRTVIAVDAAVPRLEQLQARGMRSIHLPIRYSGIEPDTRLALARALRDAEGPVYVHCHHGKHRGPAAAATAAVALGLMTPADGVAFLHEAGTSPDYPGLFECVAEAGGLTADLIDAWDGTLVEIQMVGGVRGAMSGIDWHFQALDRLAERDWSADPKDPDRTARAEAGALHDFFRRALDESVAKDAAYAADMESTVRIAAAFEQALRSGEGKVAHDAFIRLGESCNDCHTAHRVKRQW